MKQTEEQKRNVGAYVKTAALVLVLVAAITVTWMIAQPFVTRAERDRLDAVDASSALTEVVTEPEMADGSGAAGRTAIPESMSLRFDTPGWQHDSVGWWYASDEKTHYINGWVTIDDQEYHFNSRGYMDTGWTVIGGRGCYFDESGIYDRDADSGKLIALTFDDGPGEYTGRLLEILAQNDARATFFVLGARVEQNGAELLPRMRELGCQIGNHSYDNPNMTEMETDDAIEQFERTDELIAQYTGGEKSTLVRFPYGNSTEELKNRIGKPSIYWDFDSGDWLGTSAADLAQLLVERLRGGNIVLMRDTLQASVDAVEIALPQLIDAGYQFVTVEELAAARGYRLESGVTYYGFSDADIEAGHVSDKDSA